MTTRKLLSLLTLAAAALALPGLPAGVAAADIAADSTAAAFAAGGTFCFELGGQAQGEFQHLKLVTSPATGTPPFNVIPVHGVERGSWKGAEYENTFTGAATESAAASGSGTALHLTIAGGGNSLKPDGSPEIWIVQYAGELKVDSLAGTMTGYETQSAAVADGKPFAAEGVTFLRKDITPMDCAKF